MIIWESEKVDGLKLRSHFSLFVDQSSSNYVHDRSLQLRFPIDDILSWRYLAFQRYSRLSVKVATNRAKNWNWFFFGPPNILVDNFPPVGWNSRRQIFSSLCEILVGFSFSISDIFIFAVTIVCSAHWRFATRMRYMNLLLTLTLT